MAGEEKPIGKGAPFFSVVVPVHNKGLHLRRSVGSVLGQSFGDFELLLIDDASSDDGPEQMGRFQDPRIRILHRDTPGPGGYAARNLGIREAKGEWIVFLDADDEWMPDHLEKMEGLARQFPDCRFLSSGWRIVFPSGRTVEDPFSRHSAQRGPREITFREYLELCVRGLRPVWTGVACLPNTPLAVGLFPEGIAERGGDQHAWLTYLALAGKLAWSPHAGAVYHRDSVNMVTRRGSFTPSLPRKAVEDLSSLVGPAERALLKKVANRRIWAKWITGVIVRVENLFPLPASLYWKGDAAFCLARSAVSLVPKAFLRFGHRMKERVRKNT